MRTSPVDQLETLSREELITLAKYLKLTQAIIKTIPEMKVFLNIAQQAIIDSDDPIGQIIIDTEKIYKKMNTQTVRKIAELN